MTNTYLNELPKHYLIVEDGRYEVRELTLDQVMEDPFVLFEVEQVNTNVFYAEIDGIGTYYRKHGKDMEQIQEGEIAYLYARKQGMRLFLDLAFDFNAKVETDTMAYWKDIPYIQLEDDRVDVFELQVSQKKKRAQLVPRRLTHILMDLQALTLN